MGANPAYCLKTAIKLLLGTAMDESVMMRHTVSENANLIEPIMELFPVHTLGTMAKPLV